MPRRLIAGFRKLALWLLAAVAMGAVPASAQSAVLHSNLKVADFDGDGRSDYAVSQLQDQINGAYRYRVDIALTAGIDSSFLVSSTQAKFGLQIAAVDVDGDQDLDLVIRSAFDQRIIGVWINDGHGAFTEGDAAAYPQSIGLSHYQLLESHFDRRLAAELPQDAGSSSFTPPVSRCLSLPKAFADNRAILTAPRVPVDAGASSLRGPPVR